MHNICWIILKNQMSPMDKKKLGGYATIILNVAYFFFIYYLTIFVSFSKY
jgi:hypothetical protein